MFDTTNLYLKCISVAKLTRTAIMHAQIGKTIGRSSNYDYSVKAQHQHGLIVITSLVSEGCSGRLAY